MKTLAIVLGNDNYFEGAKLSNAVNDATAIKDVFERLGFEVIFNTDFTKNDISPLLSDFSIKIKNYDASIFYFAGHGFELEGENYLAPIDCQIPPINKQYANRECMRLNEILDILKENSRKIHIAIVDACRKSFDRGSIVGFSPIQAPQGTLIAFSTSPNESASDTGFTGHSVYTGALLQYIGRERLSVEDLFKKVRKTVYDLTNGRQTTWEHTSLIGDYYFNEGQLVYQINIPYDEKVVKDVYYDDTSSEFGKLIMAVKSCDWNVQNPAIDKLLSIPVNKLDKNQQFILGRNLLQASGAAWNAQKFMNEIENKILKYNAINENHVLNGILYEIYFNSYGDFRKDKTKKNQYFEKIIDLRKTDEFNNSFVFIINLLNVAQYPLIYIPKKTDEILDININAIEKETENKFERKHIQIINSITYNNIDISKQIAELFWYGTKTEHEFKQIIADFLTAPISLISIHSNINLMSIRINSFSEDDIFDK